MFADFGIVNFWTYLLGATLIVLAPGPETMFVIKTSITSGIKRGFAAIFSILISDVLLVLLAWCGLAAVISSTPALFNAIKYAGAAYLFYLGVQRRYALSLSQLSKRVRKRNLQLMLRGSSDAECWLLY